MWADQFAILLNNNKNRCITRALQNQFEMGQIATHLILNVNLSGACCIVFVGGYLLLKKGENAKLFLRGIEKLVFEGVCGVGSRHCNPKTFSRGLHSLVGVGKKQISC